ncbi:MAG: hypothetical protein IID44_29280 [Planctomycetes bacterium]|nr:hypothetical protein [Planctomycetota bacterium]
MPIKSNRTPPPSLSDPAREVTQIDFDDLTILLANWNRHTTPARGNLVDSTNTPVNSQDLTVLLADGTGPARVDRRSSGI